MHHAFLNISLPSLHDYDVKMPIFTFLRECEHKTLTLFFLFLSFDTVFWNSTPEETANIGRTEHKAISTTKSEAVRLHFLSDVLVAVTVVVTYL